MEMIDAVSKNELVWFLKTYLSTERTKAEIELSHLFWPEHEEDKWAYRKKKSYLESKKVWATYKLKDDDLTNRDFRKRSTELESYLDSKKTMLLETTINDADIVNKILAETGSSEKNKDLLHARLLLGITQSMPEGYLFQKPLLSLLSADLYGQLKIDHGTGWTHLSNVINNAPIIKGEPVLLYQEPEEERPYSILFIMPDVSTKKIEITSIESWADRDFVDLDRICISGIEDKGFRIDEGYDNIVYPPKEFVFTDKLLLTNSANLTSSYVLAFGRKSIEAMMTKDVPVPGFVDKIDNYRPHIMKSLENLV